MIIFIKIIYFYLFTSNKKCVKKLIKFQGFMFHFKINDLFICA